MRKRKSRLLEIIPLRDKSQVTLFLESIRSQLYFTEPLNIRYGGSLTEAEEALSALMDEKEKKGGSPAVLSGRLRPVSPQGPQELISPTILSERKANWEKESIKWLLDASEGSLVLVTAMFDFEEGESLLFILGGGTLRTKKTLISVKNYLSTCGTLAKEYKRYLGAKGFFNMWIPKPHYTQLHPHLKMPEPSEGGALEKPAANQGTPETAGGLSIGHGIKKGLASTLNISKTIGKNLRKTLRKLKAALGLPGSEPKNEGGLVEEFHRPLRTEREEYVEFMCLKREHRILLRKLSAAQRFHQKIAKDAELLLGPKLENVLSRLYHAKELEVNGEKYPLHYEVGLVKKKIVLLDSHTFQDPETGKIGEGAMDLVIHISGYGSDVNSAARDLSGAFTLGELGKAFAFHKVKTFDENFTEDLGLNSPYILPKVLEETWPRVLSFLMEEGVEKGIAQKYHEERLILSDKWGGAIFVCDKASGAFHVNTRGLRWNPKLNSPEKRALPFYLPGTLKETIIAETPVKALKAKTNYQGTVLVLGMLSPPQTLAPYLKDQRVILERFRNGHLRKKILQYLLDGNFNPEAPPTPSGTFKGKGAKTERLEGKEKS
jgi:hypothetical protein